MLLLFMEDISAKHKMNTRFFLTLDYEDGQNWSKSW